jgi:hypothetical protein
LNREILLHQISFAAKLNILHEEVISEKYTILFK